MQGCPIVFREREPDSTLGDEARVVDVEAAAGLVESNVKA